MYLSFVLIVCARENYSVKIEFQNVKRSMCIILWSILLLIGIRLGDETTSNLSNSLILPGCVCVFQKQACEDMLTNTKSRNHFLIIIIILLNLTGPTTDRPFSDQRYDVHVASPSLYTIFVEVNEFGVGL